MTGMGRRGNDSLLVNDLRCRLKARDAELESFRSGKRYMKLQRDHGRVVDGYIREIRRLRAELADERAHSRAQRDMLLSEREADWDEHVREIAKKDAEIARLNDRIFEEMRKGDERLAVAEERHGEESAEKDAIIEALRAELAHLRAVMDRDGTSTSLPTGQTPPGKKKAVPNSRRSSGKPKGGQAGHEKHTLEKPDDGEVNDVAEHRIEEGAACPSCGSGKLIYTGEKEEKYEYDIEIRTIKRRHVYYTYMCEDCGRTVRAENDPSLRGDCHYGPEVQALALSMMNTTNAAINKVPLMINGLTGGELDPSEGYVAKLQARAAKGLRGFKEDLFRLMVTRPLLYWDDTVMFADGKRICLRFYGDERIAYYVAHDKKDMDGIIEDGVLDALSETTWVMHDHNPVNYNERFVFLNLECNAHIQRDLQKIADETGHAALADIKGLISSTIKDRKDLLAGGADSFSEEYKSVFYGKLERLLSEAEGLAAANTSVYSGPPERALIRRIREYSANIFAWVEDFTLPTTNNLAERGLRGAKTKQKVSGQFASTETANNYADVRTYIETCRRNNLNEMEALRRLCEGNPYTVSEIFGE